MELWIRSQDKMKLIRVIDIGIFEEQEGYTIYYDDSIDNMLGTYATKERALEVLDEIQKLIKPTFKINYEYDDSQPIIDGEWLKSLKAESKIEELSCYVYEMPKE
jgi:hypothetical protein